MVLDGPINGLWFQAYIDQVLGPTLAPGDIVVMDMIPVGTLIGERPRTNPSRADRIGSYQGYLAVKRALGQG